MLARLSESLNRLVEVTEKFVDSSRTPLTEGHAPCLRGSDIITILEELKDLDEDLQKLKQRTKELAGMVSPLTPNLDAYSVLVLGS